MCPPPARSRESTAGADSLHASLSFCPPVLLPLSEYSISNFSSPQSSCFSAASSVPRLCLQRRALYLASRSFHHPRVDSRARDTYPRHWQSLSHWVYPLRPDFAATLATIFARSAPLRIYIHKKRGQLRSSRSRPHNQWVCRPKRPPPKRRIPTQQAGSIASPLLLVWPSLPLYLSQSRIHILSIDFRRLHMAS